MATPHDDHHGPGPDPASLTGNASSLPIPSFSYNTYGSTASSGERLDASPPTTPHQRLLDNDANRVQFATYRDGKDHVHPHIEELKGGTPRDPKWLPLPLRPWFWIPLVVVLALGAIGLEVALHFSKTNQGWPSSGDVGNTETALHYVYTLPPVIVAAVIVAMWAWTDIEIKKMQPYVDLVHGDSPPHRSLLLDYTRHNNFFVWTRAAANKHYLVALASLMALLALSFQPLAAALLVVRDTWFPQPGVTVNNLAALGLNQDNQFNDLTSFLTASGYAGASVLYDLGDPPFIHQQYTIGGFDLPTFIATNGTVIANTTAVKTVPNCQPISVNMQQTSTGWNNSVSFNNDCNISWAVDRNAQTLFGTDVLTCDAATPPQFGPVIFWFFTWASATICTPRLEFWDVMASVDIMTSNLTDVKELRPFSSASNFSSLAGNVTGTPLNGRAYNGINFTLDNPDEFVNRRLDALRLQLPAAIFQAAVQSPAGVIGSFSANKFVNLATRVYTTYLALVARTAYFLPLQEQMTVEVRTFKKRVWLSDTAVHLLTTAMLLLAVFGTLIQLFHRHDRRQLHLQHEPGTIASAVSIGAQTGMGELLAGRQRTEEIDDILRDKKFRIDPRTMKIIMEGEDGYEIAQSPMDRRKSIFAALQGTRPRSWRLSTLGPGAPKSPRSPDQRHV
ncbi:hypothetical protein P691DRAFT_836023 [Macrolepiota fuliginosa MF-IS2]|uniref:Uncharacterized protein n=1 Tax=Macrolepiota fuliginosa MF-IS2 TaxID=1400762 RepID=A0A9P5X5W5_9AGAR|nr:hypothetical protein P691DRAFT_836023 [Macrolepiota fuliginosa MF-IS2]